jgi:hypothetical protein
MRSRMMVNLSETRSAVRLRECRCDWLREHKITAGTLCPTFQKRIR